MKRGPCLACGRVVDVNRLGRAATHRAPDGSTHRDERVVGVEPLAPPRRDTCARPKCRRKLTAKQISNGNRYCSKSCDKQHFHDQHPGAAAEYGRVGWVRKGRPAYLRTLRRRLTALIAPAVRRLDTGALTDDDLFVLASDAYRLGRRDLQSQQHCARQRAKRRGEDVGPIPRLSILAVADAVEGGATC